MSWQLYKKGILRNTYRKMYVAPLVHYSKATKPQLECGYVEYKTIWKWAVESVSSKEREDQ